VINSFWMQQEMPRLSPSPSRFLPQNPLFRLLLVHGAAGAILGILFVVGILILDVAGIYSLLSRTGEWVVGLSMLMIGSITTFGSVSMGGAIMLLPKDEKPREPPERGLGQPVLAMSAVQVKSRQISNSRLWTD
jgi:hypothetical protein